MAIVDAPSDRQGTPFLSGFRQTPEHTADIKAVIAWLREHVGVPVWLVAGRDRAHIDAGWIFSK